MAQNTSTLSLGARLRFPRLHKRDQKSSDETPKVIIRTSVRFTLHRCAVHVIPISFTAVILFLNLRGYYIGTSFASLIESQTINLLLLQVAAKAQELLIVASLATIIFHIARHELLFGDGLPLGLIGSGILFSNFGYFFSKEFFGSLSYTGNKWRKIRFLIVLVIAGIIAALAGPATAVLLVPQSQEWTAGSTPFYMPGHYEDFFPSTLDANATGNETFCTGSGSMNIGICPSAGFKSLWEHFGQIDYSNFRTGASARNYAKFLSGSSYYWPIDSPLSMIPRVYALGQPRSIDGTAQHDTFLVQPHAATTVMLQKITTDWWEALLSVTNRPADAIDDREARADVRSPLTSTRCASPRNLTFSDTEVEFPTLLGPGIWSVESNMTVESLGQNASDHLRYRWVQLPSDTYGPASIGAVFESPWTADNSSRVVIGCTLQATWVNTTVFTDEYSFWSGWYTWDIKFGNAYPPWTTPVPGQPTSPTNGRITVTESWLDMLTPPTPSEGPGHYSWNPSTIESILMNAGFGEASNLGNISDTVFNWSSSVDDGLSRARFLETIICSVFEDGLSRAGSFRIFNTSGPAAKWSLASYNREPNFDQRIVRGQSSLVKPNATSRGVTEIEIKMRITGFAYQASLAQYLAMTVLLGHMILALSHTVWVTWRRKTSDSWDSMSKIITLAQNSSPSFHALNNTSAGIDRAKTYSRKAKIRTTESSGIYGGDHVELVFNECPTQDETVERASDDIPLNQPQHYSTWPVVHPKNISMGFGTNGSKTSLTELVRASANTEGLSTALFANDIVKVGKKYG